jgi:predicted kinase
LGGAKVELAIFIGLQGAGKSSFYRSRFALSHVHISKDLLGRVRNRRMRELALVEQAMESGKPVVVDDTNPRVEDRAPLIALGKQFGARVIGYYFDASVAECLERNARRTGKARVPAVAIYTTARRMEVPTVAEGFDALFRVRFKDDHFETEAIA